MGKVAMLSVDLNKVTSNQRDLFYKKLKELKWSKIANLTTIWKVSFEEDVSKVEAISITKDDVKASAKYAKIISYDAVVHIGDSSPAEF